MMERKIGEIFEYNGEWYQCIEHSGCYSCAFDGGYTCSFKGDSYCATRSDNKLFIFKKLEKVGEPFYTGFYCSWVQKYKLYDNHAIGEYPKCHFGADYVLIEIKQNKEDMEEKKQGVPAEIINGINHGIEPMSSYHKDMEENKEIQLNDLVNEYVNELIYNKEFEKGIKEWFAKHSNPEKIGRDLKEFDIEAAKVGKPVCTRDGRKARIICFDKKGDHPIIALIMDEEREIESIGRYFENGHLIFENVENRSDLMMLPEKKEGWVHIRKDIALYETMEEAERTRNGNDNYVSVKVEWEE